VRDPAGDTDGIVGALGERLSAGIEHGATTLRLALAETRLAATSAILLVGIALGTLVLAILIWLLLVALAGYGLWAIGLSPAFALLVLLGVHVAAALALGLLARRLMRDLRFAHTRRALADARFAAPEGTPPAGNRAAPDAPLVRPDEPTPDVTVPARASIGASIGASVRASTRASARTARSTTAERGSADRGRD